MNPAGRRGRSVVGGDKVYLPELFPFTAAVLFFAMFRFVHCFTFGSTTLTLNPEHSSFTPGAISWPRVRRG